MIYLVLITTDATILAACETEAGAVQHEARGYIRVTPARFRWLWRERDMARLTALRGQQDRPAAKELARMIGM